MEMEEQTQELDDGELWLPSDIFPLEEVSPASEFNNPNYHSTRMEELACGVAAFNFLERNTPTQSLLKPPPNTQRFRPAVGCGSSCSTAGDCFGYHGFSCVANGTGGVWTGHMLPPYPCHFLNPVQSQVESFMEGGARLVQSHYNLLMMDPVLENRFLRHLGSGVGMRGNGVGFVSGYGGTGVFLPRISTNTTNNTTTTNDHHPHHARKRHGMRNRHNFELFPHRNFLNGIELWKQNDCQVSTEVCLPKDWTY